MYASFHSVKTIELTSAMESNSNSRTVRIVDDKGRETTLTFFGDTGVLDRLPKSADFVAHE